MALVASVATVSVAPLSASATATNKCLWYDFDIQPKTPGAPSGPFDNCVEHPEREPEASYYWTDETSVFYEPRNQAFDYSAFSQLNPFTGDGYSFRKANELFPTTPDASAAAAKLQYAQAALGAKPRAIENRRGVDLNDVCDVVPQLWTDYQIRNELRWLPAVPMPDGDLGTYTYELSSTLSGEQRAMVLDALVQFDEARQNTSLPRLIPWEGGSEVPPTVTFQSGNLFPSEGEPPAQTTYDNWDKGREHLTRWIDGHISISPEIQFLSSLTIAHEILHFYGFSHLPRSVPGATMSAFTNAVYVNRSAWMMNSENPPPGVEAIDVCTKSGMSAVAAY